jgi:hypothetical protein
MCIFLSIHIRYATSSYDIFNASAITLSPYMVWDYVQPFVADIYTYIYLYIIYTPDVLYVRQICYTDIYIFSCASDITFCVYIYMNIVIYVNAHIWIH